MSEELFVSAWKKGIKKVGAEFFDIKASSLDMAQKKWQLEPNYQFIKNAIGSYSHGKQVLLGLMYSFYDPECGQELLIQVQSPNFVQAIFILDEEARNIIAQLWLHHTGW
ncbi:hypothetical protein [Fluoribacter dumoffii]|uniref:Uncharacterized protein n=1 Tax=Fluoribacter dumoffii TaxID=463 RepID=A0A377ITV9_9GAMM|nr:hypothetical protein [Fluoribacter dumoffii]STO91558.1 Uncharacterised protein [Fluoribacter dumoffii]